MVEEKMVRGRDSPKSREVEGKKQGVASGTKNKERGLVVTVPSRFQYFYHIGFQSFQRGKPLSPATARGVPTRTCPNSK